MSFKITGRYMNGREVTGYHMVDLKTGRARKYTREQVCFYAGAKQIENCMGNVYEDKVILRGVGVALEDLPIKQEGTIQMHEQTDDRNAGKASTSVNRNIVKISVEKNILGVDCISNKEKETIETFINIVVRELKRLGVQTHFVGVSDEQIKTVGNHIIRKDNTFKCTKIIRMAFHKGNSTLGLQIYAVNLWLDEVCKWNIDTDILSNMTLDREIMIPWSKISNGNMRMMTESMEEFIDIIHDKITALEVSKRNQKFSSHLID